MRGYVRTTCAIALLALVSGCGTMHVGASASSTPETQKALPPPICPQAAADVSAPPCVSVGVQQYQQSNEMYNVRKPLPSSLAAEAQPETQRVRRALERLTPAQRQNPSAVIAALRGVGMLSSGLVAYGPYEHGVTFGGYEPLNAKQAVCAFGHVTPTAVVVNIGGNTWEGACYTSGGE